MEKSDVQKILNYYLEYEIYNVANSSKIKVDNKQSLIIRDISNEEEIYQSINKLKEIKIRQKIEEFMGKRIKNIQKIIEQVMLKLMELDEKQSNIIQVSFGLENLIRENLQYVRKDKLIEVFVKELCALQALGEFLLYAHNITVIYGQVTKKLPIFILKCDIRSKNIKVVEVNVNTETLSTILSIILNKEVSEVVLEYEELISNYVEEIKTLIDAGDVEHLLSLYYAKLEEYFNISIEQLNEINIRYRRNKEYIISLDEITEEGIKYIKEDIETLTKIINYDGYVPKVLNKYLCGSENKKDINASNYNQMYKGNYKSKFGINENQYKIVNAIKNNDIIAIEGPPGTGKTSLLKEIISNNIVERTNLLLENWNEGLKERNYQGANYYYANWWDKNKEVIKSIVVSSKNGEAIENVGREINKEMKYMFPIARRYIRTEQEGQNKKKRKANYRGIVCLPLGKQDNIQDFKEFLYKEYIPKLQKIATKRNIDKYEEKIKVMYENKIKEIEIAEDLIRKIVAIIKDKTDYFYGIQILEKDTSEQKQKKIEEIEKRLLKDKEITIKEKERLKNAKEVLSQQIHEKVAQLNKIEEGIEEKEGQIETSEKSIIERRNNIEYLENKRKRFEMISKNIFTKMLNYKEYRENKSINFTNAINEMVTKNETEDKKISYNIDGKNNLEKERINEKIQCSELNEKYESIISQYETSTEKIIEIELIQIFNQWDKKTVWNYTNNWELYGKSPLNKLNQDLFELALKVNEAYIIKNSEEIIENLQLFLMETGSFVCQKFYDSTDIYNDEKQEGIRSLWNTLFLCFPVVTTTLDSFSKRYFHLIPEYIDLELIDEAGQILPHNLVSALYRTKKAVIVGDVNQIEPICNNISKNFLKRQQEIGLKFESIKIPTNSIQTLANRNTDILDNGENIILNEHYRCEENIINFSNEYVYGKKLNMHKQNEKAKPLGNNMVALDVRGKKEDNYYTNKLEVDSCIEAIKYIIEQTANEKDKPTIAIITPFKSQKNELKNRLELEGFVDIKVGTIHAFQGQEKDYIIFSQVVDSLSPKSIIHFIGRKCNMLNVAVTRAKKQFIYLGNLEIAMKADNYMSKLVKYIKKNGLLYSLYDMESSALNDNWDEQILQILQPELKLENDDIGLYLKQYSKKGIMKDAKQHYELLKYAIKNAKSEIFIMAPWIRKNVIDDECINDIKKLKAKECRIKMVYGYKKVDTNVASIGELVERIKSNRALGYASETEVKEIIQVMYETIGKENFIYAGPTHAKIFIIDDKYMLIGSHNWLSNAGKTDENKRAIEGTVITTNKGAINYAKQEFF